MEFTIFKYVHNKKAGYKFAIVIQSIENIYIYTNL